MQIRCTNKPKTTNKELIMTRKPYRKSKLILHGDVESLTRGAVDGNFTDATFPDGTPRGDLTFTVSN